MGLLDILPWKKKNNDFDSFNDTASNDSFSDPLQSQDQNGFSQSGQQDSFADPLGDGLGLQYDQHKQQTSSHQQMSGAPSYPSSQNTTSTTAARSFDNPMGGSLPEPVAHTTSQGHDDRRDVELMLAKLDAIKAELDSVHQRVRTIESAMGVNKQSTTHRYKW